jgi:hypothetical protein
LFKANNQQEYLKCVSERIQDSKGKTVGFVRHVLVSKQINEQQWQQNVQYFMQT